jgi:hypothetical protein
MPQFSNCPPDDKMDNRTAELLMTCDAFATGTTKEPKLNSFSFKKEPQALTPARCIAPLVNAIT